MTFEERMAELGVDLSDLPDEHSMEQCASACIEASKWSKYTDYTVPYEYILHLTDIIDRMETRIVNLTGERDYLLTLYGYDCEECKRYDECNKDGDCCKRDIVEDWAGVPEDWRHDDDRTD